MEHKVALKVQYPRKELRMFKDERETIGLSGDNQNITVKSSVANICRRHYIEVLILFFVHWQYFTELSTAQCELGVACILMGRTTTLIIEQLVTST